LAWGEHPKAWSSFAHCGTSVERIVEIESEVALILVLLYFEVFAEPANYSINFLKTSFSMSLSAPALMNWEYSSSSLCFFWMT